MTTQGRKATIYDIAKLAGASPSTVSAALSPAWKTRRISEQTVEAIRQIATEQGYSTNMQARGLRRAKSGLVGMVIPVHDNRFFSSMSQSFEAFARERGLVPVIASSMRDAAEERRIVETLISYAVDYIFVAGATDPASVTELCAAAGLRHIFIDLPGPGAPSVISDNYQGAQVLTQTLRAGQRPIGEPARDRIYFIGGDTADHATARRIEGFRDVLAAGGAPAGPDQIIACGYSPRRATQEIAALCARIGGLPAGLFINSIRAFEGVLGHFVTLPPGSFEQTVIGCYDYDPFAAYLHFPVHMVRQDSHRLIEEAYRLIDAPDTGATVCEIMPTLVAPRTIPSGPFGTFG